MADKPTDKQLEEMRKQRDEYRIDKGTKKGYKDTTDRDDSGAEKPTVKKHKCGGKVTKKYAKGGSVRGGGCETKGKTKGRMV
jgi:hypothetical protein